MNGMWKRGVVAIVALTAVGMVSGASAQTSARGNGDRVDVAKATQYEAQAERYAADKSGFGRAARLYRKAAELRPEGDPRAVKDLVRAGKLAFYEGSESRAVRDLRRAGEAALSYGDVMTAAGAFLDAAWVAGKGGHGTDVLDLVERARRLAQSPLIAEARRAALLSRIDVAEQ